MRAKIYGLASIAALAFYAFAQYQALAVVPPDRMMGDIYRILFIHVPAAWISFVFFFLSFIGSAGYLSSRKPAFDRLASCSAEIGLVLTGLTLALGSLWGKPIWGVWWTWDPRLTTTALLFILYAGYLMIRKLIDDPDRRAKLSAVVGLLVFLNVPIVYLSVKWWRSLHQVQSSPETMAPEMVLTLRMNALALLFLGILFLVARMNIAKRQDQLDERDTQPPLV